MQILVDSYSSEDIQSVIDEIAKEEGQGAFTAQVSSSGAKRIKPKISTDMLDRWDVQTHKYGADLAVKVGFLASLFSGSGESVSAGVIHDAKRFCIRKLKDGREVQFGVAVRLSVALTRLEVEADLSIPNLAAAAQLGMSDSRIGISVEGYFGPIGDLLPTPEDLNVENFARFTGATEEIQKRVFGPDGINYFSPTVLSYIEQPN